MTLQPVEVPAAIVVGLFLTALSAGAECVRVSPKMELEGPDSELVFSGKVVQIIRDALAGEGASLDLLVLLFANAATVTAATIDEAIAAMSAHPDFDSAVTVSCYNMWSPVRARRIDADGLLQPFVPFEAFGDPATLTCDRDSQGDVWFADMGLSVVRPHCLERLENGVLPQRWMGRRIHPIRQWGGLDVDYEWQIPLVEHWLRAHGVDAAREDSYEWSRA